MGSNEEQVDEKLLQDAHMLAQLLYDIYMQDEVKR